MGDYQNDDLRLGFDKAAALALLNELVQKAERAPVGKVDPFEEQGKLPLIDGREERTRSEQAPLQYPEQTYGKTGQEGPGESRYLLRG